MTREKVVTTRAAGAAFFAIGSCIAAGLIGPDLSPAMKHWLGAASIFSFIGAVILASAAFIASTDSYWR